MNYIRTDQCPECCISQPNFINLPRSIQNLKEHIEVQCNKCIDGYLFSKWLHDHKENSIENANQLGKMDFQHIRQITGSQVFLNKKQATQSNYLPQIQPDAINDDNDFDVISSDKNEEDIASQIADEEVGIQHKINSLHNTIKMSQEIIKM